MAEDSGKGHLIRAGPPRVNFLWLPFKLNYLKTLNTPEKSLYYCYVREHNHGSDSSSYSQVTLILEVRRKVYRVCIPGGANIGSHLKILSATSVFK